MHYFVTDKTNILQTTFLLINLRELFLYLYCTNVIHFNQLEVRIQSENTSSSMFLVLWNGIRSRGPTETNTHIVIICIVKWSSSPEV